MVNLARILHTNTNKIIKYVKLRTVLYHTIPYPSVMISRTVVWWLELPVSTHHLSVLSSLLLNDITH